MEGKAVLFKKFAGIDVFDIEIDERDPDKLVDIIAALEPTFGGINLEDIKAPECFYRRAQAARAHEDPGVPRRPARHRDHRRRGGAQRRSRSSARRSTTSSSSCSGAGAAALACLDLLVDARHAGARTSSVTDIEGVVYQGRTEVMDPNKARYAHDTTARTLAEVIAGADVFLGLSAGGVLKPEMVAQMARAAADPGARQSRAGDPARRSRRRCGPTRHRHRALGLSEPGQQRPVLSVHLPRRARCRRDRRSTTR